MSAITQSVHRTTLITRAVPGSGKTSLSRRIREHLEKAGLRTASHSTDEYFMDSAGMYRFDPARLVETHRANLDAFENSVAQGLDLVICDNTNLSPWESAPYCTLARAHGYRIIVLDFLPRTLERHVASQQVTAEKPDAHGVPEVVLRHMIRMSHIHRHLLDPTYPVDRVNDVKVAWDHLAQNACATLEVLEHYDIDATITLLPENFQEHKAGLGKRILMEMRQT